MIQVTLQFKNIDAAINALRQIPEAGVLQVSQDTLPTTGLQDLVTKSEEKHNPKKSAKESPAPTQPTATEAVADAPAKTEGVSSQSAASADPEPQASTAAIDFETVKKAFLTLSTAKGRSACEAVLKPFALGKLSDAKPEQYAGLMEAIQKAAA